MPRSKSSRKIHAARASAKTKVPPAHADAMRADAVQANVTRGDATHAGAQRADAVHAGAVSAGAVSAGAMHADAAHVHAARTAAAHADGITRREAVALIVAPVIAGSTLIGCAARGGANVAGQPAAPGTPPTGQPGAAAPAAPPGQTAPATQSGASAGAGAGAGGGAAAGRVDLKLPLRPGSLRLLVIGDSGTGGRAQQEVANQIVAYRQAFPFDFALMLGDNMYGRQRPQDYVRKFEIPYKPLLDAGVTFHAALGNHDLPRQRFYPPFNMNGERYYTFKKGDARFFALDSTQMDAPQVAWLRRELEKSPEDWKICFAHHPLYSSGGRHGSLMSLRKLTEPLFIEHGVSVVFAGHDHFYERIRPQQGIQYFVCGGAAKLRRGDIRPSAFEAAGFDRDRSFMLVEIAGDELFFQAISRTGETVDQGVVPRVVRKAATGAGAGTGNGVESGRGAEVGLAAAAW